MSFKRLLWFVSVCALAQNGGSGEAARLRELVRKSPRLPLTGGAFPIQPPLPDWALGMVSWVATDAQGRIYILQRGLQADPIVVCDRSGRVLRSWGKGLYTMPHSIRIDPQGNVWTTDAASSKVLKFSPEGKPLQEISVGGQPSPCPNNFCGVTDVAFAPNGHLFISDGYSNARVLEYTPAGRKVREWGEAGTGPGQFHLVHSIAIDENGIVYVADRENGRIQRFQADGRFLGEWSHLGKTFSITSRGGALWISTQPRNQPNFSPGWLMKIDPRSGAVLGYVENTGNHGVEATADGELLVGPGPQAMQWFRASAH